MCYNEAGRDKFNGKALRRLLLFVFLFSLLIQIAFHFASANETVNHLTLKYEDGFYTAIVNNDTAIRIPAPSGASGKLGLYIFHPYEPPPEKTYFQNLHIRIKNGPVRHGALSLLDPRHQRQVSEGQPGWEVERGKGLIYKGKKGDRSILLLENVGEGEFSIHFDLVNARDAGVMFHAKDDRNGRVFVVRSHLNDMFFFDLAENNPGPILEIARLRELDWKIELLRFTALLAGVGMDASILLLIVLTVAPLFPRLSRRRPHLSIPVSSKWILAAMLGATFISLLSVSYFSLHGIPHIADESAYLFQAKIFASGRFWGTIPPLPEFFRHDHMIFQDGRWFSKYPPMFSALLALGVKTGYPHLVNPLLATGLCVLIMLLTFETTHRRRAVVISWILTTSSPFFLFMGANLMSHTAAAFFLTAFIYFILRGIRTGSYLSFIIAGAGLGSAILTRPYTALLISVPLGIFLCSKWIRSS